MSSRHYSDLDDLISDLDETESLSDDPYGTGGFDDEDFAIMGSFHPDAPRPKRVPVKQPAKRGRKPKSKA